MWRLWNFHEIINSNHSSLQILFCNWKIELVGSGRTKQAGKSAVVASGELHSVKYTPEYISNTHV